MDAFHAYVPTDRLHALLEGRSLSERVEGTALFADLSGFTALTEMLVQDLGPQRGAEELLVFLDKVYEPLISQVGRYRGSVIGFSGDAITCWFDQDQGHRAAACAVAMQTDINALGILKTSSGRDVSIGVKVAVASGSARRFLVGYPEVQVIDVLAGTPLEKLASAEHQASKGEIVLDSSTANVLADEMDVFTWRTEEATGERFAVLGGLKTFVEPNPWPDLHPGEIDIEKVRPWLLPPVLQRLASGGGEFLAELRPAVALFLRFGGIDYNNDEEAGKKLDQYIRQVQQVITRFEGSLIQLTIGDKGSYLYAAFGAPIAHEDDARRAVLAGQELRRLRPAPEWEGQVQIGVSEGRMRTGAYGSRSRRTYGVLGPQTNLAARLMQTAAPGQILASPVVHQSTAQVFAWTELPPVRLKGVAEPLPVFSLQQETAGQTIHLQEPRYTLPMIGRKAELAFIEDKLERAVQGHGQIVMITGEAGMGKSRLMAEAIRLSLDHDLEGYGGECYSYGANTSYHLWHNIWRGFFNLQPGWSQEEVTDVLQIRLAEIDPKFVQRLPLLGPVLNLTLVDNDLTRSLDAKRRKNLLENLLVTLLRERSRQKPILLVLENVHWYDPLSEELANTIARSIANLPVFILMARRPAAAGGKEVDPLQDIPYYSCISLSEFSTTETEQLIRLKLEQIMGGQFRIPTKLIQDISRRSQGNPFYIEELLNYLRDKNIDPGDLKSLEKVDLPRSLQSLILTRIDQRTESQKITLKVASVIGRVFIAAWLWGVYPELGDPTIIKKNLEVLSDLDLTPLENVEPELSYLFKHIVTMEVAYDSLPYATRALLHDQIGGFIERTMPDELESQVDLLAFHYSQSNNVPKKREYLLKAGTAAQANYANLAAINYYNDLLPLLEGLGKIEVLLKLGQVLELVGKWDEAEEIFQNGLEIGLALGDRRIQARCQTSMGELMRKRSAYQEAAEWFEAAREGFEVVDDLTGVGQVMHFAGTLAIQQGEYPEARKCYEESLVIRRNLEDRMNIANLLNNLGILSRYENNNMRARELYLESLSIRREIGDRWGITVSLSNLGIHAMDMNELEDARTYLEEAVSLQREIGDLYYLANYLNNLGNVARTQGDYDYARELYCESLDKNRELGDGWQTAYILEDMGGLAALAGELQRAVMLIAAASALRERIAAPLPPQEQARLNEFIKITKQGLDPAEWDQIWAVGQVLSMEQAIDFAICETLASEEEIEPIQT
jgi:adenylate cyclase